MTMTNSQWNTGIKKKKKIGGFVNVNVNVNVNVGQCQIPSETLG